MIVVKFQKTGNTIVKRCTYCFTVLLFLIFISGCSQSYTPTQLKDYYKPLVQNQYSLNKEDIDNKKQYAKSIAEGREPAMKYYFKIDNRYYYALNDIIYSREGAKITDLQPKSEGYFTYDNNLYYVYGEEQEKDVSTLGGPVAYTLKYYKYRRFDLNKLDDIQIKRGEYEKQYFELSKNLGVF
jgi:hypothetical protein